MQQKKSHAEKSGRKRWLKVIIMKIRNLREKSVSEAHHITTLPLLALTDRCHQLCFLSISFLHLVTMWRCCRLPLPCNLQNWYIDGGSHYCFHKQRAAVWHLCSSSALAELQSIHTWVNGLNSSAQHWTWASWPAVWTQPKTGRSVLKLADTSPLIYIQHWTGLVVLFLILSKASMYLISSSIN